MKEHVPGLRLERDLKGVEASIARGRRVGHDGYTALPAVYLRQDLSVRRPHRHERCVLRDAQVRVEHRNDAGPPIVFDLHFSRGLAEPYDEEWLDRAGPIDSLWLHVGVRSKIGAGSRNAGDQQKRTPDDSHTGCLTTASMNVDIYAGQSRQSRLAVSRSGRARMTCGIEAIARPSNPAEGMPGTPGRCRLLTSARVMCDGLRPPRGRAAPTVLASVARISHAYPGVAKPGSTSPGSRHGW